MKSNQSNGPGGLASSTLGAAPANHKLQSSAKLIPMKPPDSAIASVSDTNGGRLRSALQEYSQLFDEIQREKLNSHDVSRQILEPKNEYVNNLLAQHLLQSQYPETFRALQQDITRAKSAAVPRVFLNSFQELKEILMKSYYKGQEKEFFKARDKIVEELNYFKFDYHLDSTIEFKLKAYFAAYYLIPMHKKNMPIEEAMRLTKERSESFKKYTTEFGSRFLDDPLLKHFLRLPYLLQTLPKEDALLDNLLSDEFAIKTLKEAEDEFDQVIFFCTKVAINKSFIIKAFEYNLKTNPALNTSTVLHVYSRIEQRIKDKESKDLPELQEETASLEELGSRLEDKYLRVKEELVSKSIELEDSHLRVKPAAVASVTVPRSSEASKYNNWVYLEYFHRLKETRRAFAETLGAETAQGKLRTLELEKLKQEIRKPVGLDTPAEPPRSPLPAD